MTEKRTNTDKFMLRLPDGMRERIRQVAEKNGRSMNAEIVHALEGYLQPKFVIDTGTQEDPTPEDLRDGEPPIPISPEVRQAMERFVQQITDDAQRRLMEWLWLNEADKADE